MNNRVANEPSFINTLLTPQKTSAMHNKADAKTNNVDFRETLNDAANRRHQLNVQDQQAQRVKADRAEQARADASAQAAVSGKPAHDSRVDSTHAQHAHDRKADQKAKQADVHTQAHRPAKEPSAADKRESAASDAPTNDIAQSETLEENTAGIPVEADADAEYSFTRDHAQTPGLITEQNPTSLLNTDSKLAVASDESTLSPLQTQWSSESVGDAEAVTLATALDADVLLTGGIELPVNGSELNAPVKLDPLPSSVEVSKLTGMFTEVDKQASGAVKLEAATTKVSTAETEKAGTLELAINSESDAAAPESKLDFAKLMEAAKTSARETPLANVEQALAQTKTTATTTALEAGIRPLEAQASVNRGFVVQTGVPASLGQPRWGEAVGERVLWLAAQNISSAELRLDPPELGPMQVKITIQNDQASVSFSSPHLAVREALDQSAARLRDMFNAQGLDLVDVDVSDQSFARQQPGDEDSPNRGRNMAGELSDEETVVGVMTLPQNIRLVDHYA